MKRIWVALAAVVFGSSAAMASVGSPNAVGYYWVDDREPGFAFEDPVFRTPRQVALEGDAAAPQRLPFEFTYFGRTYDHVQPTADGRLRLLFLGGERQQMRDADDLLSTVTVPARGDVAILDVFGGVRPGMRSVLVFDDAGQHVTVRWASFDTGLGGPITFEAHLRHDGRIRYQYFFMDGYLEGPAYGQMGDVGLRDPAGNDDLKVMSSGVALPGFDLRSASVIEFPVIDFPVRQLPAGGPAAGPKVVSCPPAFGLPTDFTDWCDRTEAGVDRLLGTVDDRPPCIQNAGTARADGTLRTACDTVQASAWYFREGEGYCENCPYTLYVRVDCGTDMHMPTHDVEAMVVSIIDLNTGLPQPIIGENECTKRQRLGTPFVYCDACLELNNIIPKDDAFPPFKAAGSCFVGPPFSRTAPDTPCFQYYEVASAANGWQVGWGRPLNAVTPDSDGSGFLEQDEMAIPPCVSQAGPCGRDTGSNAATEEQVVDVVLTGNPVLSGIYRLEILGGGLEWELYMNCDGEQRASGVDSYPIYATCAAALADYSPRPQLSLSPGVTAFTVDETNCPARATFGVTMCNTGGIEATSAPFRITFAPTGVPFNTDFITATNCGGDPRTGLPLLPSECRTCFFDVPVGGTDLTARIDIDPDRIVLECEDVGAVRCTYDPGARFRTIPVCAASCTASGNALIAGSPFCPGTTVTIDGSRSSVSGCLGGVIEYQYELFNDVSGTWSPMPGGAYNAGPSFDFIPASGPTELTYQVRSVVRCSSNLPCQDPSTPVSVRVLADTDGDTIGDTCGDNCPTIANSRQEDIDGDFRGDVCDNCPTKFNFDQEQNDGDPLGDLCDNCPFRTNPANPLPFDCNGDGDTADFGEGAGEQCDQDSDTLGELCDNCLLVANNEFVDQDGDTFFDPIVYGEAPQSDLDTDGRGDLCDLCPSFSDGGNLTVTDCNGDGDTTDPGEGLDEQCDEDGDGVGDGCDLCEKTPNPRNSDPLGFDCDGDTIIENGVGEDVGEAWLEQCDQDSDEVGDACDNCLSVINPGNVVPRDCNADRDTLDPGEGIGEQCDNDGDTVGNACDICPDDVNPIHVAAFDCNGDFDTNDPGEAPGEQCGVCPCIASPEEAASGVDGFPHLVVEKSQLSPSILITAREDLAVELPPVPPRFIADAQGDYAFYFYGLPFTPAYIDEFNVYRGTLDTLLRRDVPNLDPARYDHSTYAASACGITGAPPGVSEPRTAPFTNPALGAYDTAACGGQGCLGDGENYYYLAVGRCAPAGSAPGFWREGPYGYASVDYNDRSVQLPPADVLCP